MHIAFWSPSWPLETSQNGIVTYVHWMKRGLEARGHRVSVFTGAYASSVPVSDVHLVKLGARKQLFRTFRQRLADPALEVFDFSHAIASAISRVHRSDPIDLVEMEESFGWFADVARRTRIPLVVKLHGPAFLSLVEEELRTAFAQTKIVREGEALRVANAILSPCASTLAETIERYSLRPKLCRHIVNPLTMSADTPVWRFENCDADTILFVGRFDLRKGGDLVLQAFRLCLRVRPTLKLIFVGPDFGLLGPDGVLVNFDEYCTRVLSVHERERVDYRGRQPNEEIAKLRVSASTTLVASRWENPGYTLLEAMYQGCPVVTTDAGGTRETVIHGKSALLATSGDPVSLAEQILSLIDDPDRARSLGSAARQSVLKTYSADTVASASLDFYREAIQSH